MRKLSLIIFGLFIFSAVKAQTFSLTKTNSDFNSEFGTYFKENENFRNLLKNVAKDFSSEQLKVLLTEDINKFETIKTLISKDKILEVRNSFLKLNQLFTLLIKDTYGSLSNFNGEDFKLRVTKYFETNSNIAKAAYMSSGSGCSLFYGICLGVCGSGPEGASCRARCEWNYILCVLYPD